jgi:alpha-amylase/alpha-mannosidase (GH57 family)
MVIRSKNWFFGARSVGRFDLFLFQKAKHYYFQGYRRATKAFILAKEIAYNYLQITERLYTFSWIKFDNFDQVLNNFTPSYFAGALLIPRQK